ncbi:DUF4157 domain-containing protein [Flavobacterium chungangensis]|uniref:DUF4157 domain-containing protein n=1 Tax=Flavobacterium chungangensis TaxID=2708132 RepID=A0ABV8ZJ70_9FLAO
MAQDYQKISENKIQATAANANCGNTAIQLKDNREHSAIQLKLTEKTASQEATSSPIQTKRNVTGLPDNLKSGIENLSGHSMDDVKVHYNSDKPAQLNAHAYAQGTDIHVASGQEKHLPHEAWHVVQQKQGRVKPTIQLKGKANINDDKGLEKEADVMGAKAIQKTGPTSEFKNRNLNSNVNQDKVIQGYFSDIPYGQMFKNIFIQHVTKFITELYPGNLMMQEVLHQYILKVNSENDEGTSDDFLESYGISTSDVNNYVTFGKRPLKIAKAGNSHFGLNDDGGSSNSDDSTSSYESSDNHDEFSGSEESSYSSEFSNSDEESSSFESEKSEDNISIMHDSLNNDHLRLRRIIKQGIFNAIGEGLNPRYIRSNKNKLIQLIGQQFGARENKLGLLPDLYKGLNTDVLAGVIAEIESELSTSMQIDDKKPKKNKSIDQYITMQREISGAIKQQFQSPTGNIELIHDGNYPPLIIHFPLLRDFIVSNQERRSLRHKKIRSGQAKGMTKLLSARLMSLYNQNRGGNLPRLVEKSSFGFQIATLADLGDNLSIRLSPGINKDISAIIVKALTVIDNELHQLMTDKTEVEFTEKVAASDKLYEYWQTGKATKEVSSVNLMKSYNKKKTLLKHLVFTQVETGSKGLSMIGRVLERNHDNIIFFTANDSTLSKMAQMIFEKSTKAELEKNISKTGLSSPNLDSSYDKHIQEVDEMGDELEQERLAIFEHILQTLKNEKKKIDFDNDTVSDSEYEDEVTDNQGTMNIKTGKVVVSSGMAALSMLLTEDNTTHLKKERTRLLGQKKRKKANRKSLTEEDLLKIAARIEELEKLIPPRTKGKGKNNKAAIKEMIPNDSSVYYEDHDVIDLMDNTGIPGYTAKDIILLDINPNITQSPKNKISFNGELTKLVKSGKKVWVVDLTSSTSKEQEKVYLTWKSCKSSTLLITRVSGIKQQEEGHNINPHGLIHWAHKTNKADGHDIIKGYFGDLQKKFPRSRISNEIRRYFKENLKSYSWKRVEIRKGKTGALTSSSLAKDDDDGYSSEDEKKDPRERKR